MRGVFCPSYSPPRPRAPEKAPSENAWCFFCPLRFPTTSARRHLEKSRREKSCADPRGFADFYQRFFLPAIFSVRHARSRNVDAAKITLPCRPSPWQTSSRQPTARHPRKKEFLPISMPATAIAVLSFEDIACSLSLAPLASVTCWRGRSTAGPFH